MDIFKCPNNCCTIKVKPYKRLFNKASKVKCLKRKAGALIYDPQTNHILLVQSRGHLWGPPKGTIDQGESEMECSIREVKEETGLDITSEEISKGTNINDKAIYYYIEKPVSQVDIQDTLDNDANGICWIKIKCLADCINNGNISVTHHCRVVINRLLGVILPYSKFIKVKK